MFEFDGRQALTELVREAPLISELPVTCNDFVDDILQVAVGALLLWRFPELEHQTPLTCVSCVFPPALLAAVEGELLRRLR